MWVDWHRLVGVSLVVAILEIEAVTSSRRHGPLVVNIVVVAVMGLSAALLRRRPLVALVFIGTGAIVLAPGLTAPGLSGATFAGLYCVIAPTFSVAAWENRRRAILGFALWLAFTGVVSAVAGASLKDVGPAALTAFLAWVAGRVLHADRQLVDALHERRIRVEARRAENQLLAVTAERMRIAGELHTGVTQAVATMVIQAESAWPLLDRDELAAEHALATAEETGRGALMDMRRILGTLRRPDSARQLLPQPGCDDIHELVRRRREIGQKMEFAESGERPSHLPAIIDVSIYRLLDALLPDANDAESTNTAIVISFGHVGVDVTMTVVGATQALTLTSTVRERVAVCGGAIDLVRDTTDGQTVHFHLPSHFETTM